MGSDADAMRRAADAVTHGPLRSIARLHLLALLPALLMGAVLAHLPHVDPAQLVRPLAYVVEPAVDAWRRDADGALLGYLALQGGLVLALGAFFRGALARAAVVDVGTGKSIAASEAYGFGRRRFAALAAVRLLRWASVLPPLALGVALLGVGLQGIGASWLALLLLGVGVLGVPALLALVEGVVALGLLPTALAVEGGVVGHATRRTHRIFASRPAGLAGLGLRARGRALAQSLARAALGAAAAGAAVLLLRALVGEAALHRAASVLALRPGTPAALRPDVGSGDVLLAALLAAGAAGLLLAWLADLAARLEAARALVYLRSREVVEGTAPSVLVPPPSVAPHEGPAEAGFVLMERLS